LANNIFLTDKSSEVPTVINTPIVKKVGGAVTRNAINGGVPNFQFGVTGDPPN